MKKKISFEEIGALTVTFYAEEGVTAGQVVKLSQDSTVGACTAGDWICGAATWTEDGYAAVQLKGFVEVPYTGSVELGWNKLAADGKGGVTVNEEGADHLVAALDAASGIAVICL